MAKKEFNKDGRELVDRDDPRVGELGGFYDAKSGKVALMTPDEGEQLFDRQGNGDE